MIRSGQVLCHGRPQEVLHNPEARKYYFGEGLDLGPQRPPRPHLGEPRRTRPERTTSPAPPSAAAA